DNGEKFRSLLTAVSAYAEGSSADPIIRRVLNLWKKLEARLSKPDRFVRLTRFNRFFSKAPIRWEPGSYKWGW
ncbi:hypothetical protein Tsubulata_039426, partial [Turnera subulata]